MEQNYNLCDLQTREVESEYAKRFISKYHYSKSCSNIVLAVGEWLGMELKNCIIFNYCAGRNMANEVWGGNNNNTIELSRMVSLEPKPKNLESFSIKRALDFLKRKMPNIKVVISYADNTMGHKGYCYQATNFVYYGQSRTTKEFYLDGKRTHERTLFNTYKTASSSELKKILGDRFTWKTSDLSKSRYYIIIAQNKKERKEIEKKILVKSMPYPKGDNTRYDMYKNGNFSSLNDEEAEKETKVDLSRQLSIFDF